LIVDPPMFVTSTHSSALESVIPSPSQSESGSAMISFRRTCAALIGAREESTKRTAKKKATYRIVIILLTSRPLPVVCAGTV